MVWFLGLHIGALLLWVGGLLLLGALIASPPGDSALTETPARVDSVPRFLFTQIASPAAAIAIMAGTGVFLINQTTEPWLIAKLVLVAGLVVVHCLTGWLVIRWEAEDWPHTARAARVLLVASCVLTVSITWLVLAKPDWEWPL